VIMIMINGHLRVLMVMIMIMISYDKDLLIRIHYVSPK